MIVIALSRVPASLRGDLTKWCQEIQTGIYVGRFSARIRDLLWERIQKNIGNGEATIVYTTNNELGYAFRSTREDREVVNYDGIPLLMHLEKPPSDIKHGFSDAAKFHHAKQARKGKETGMIRTVVALDIETTGLNSATDEIISIGAVKSTKGRGLERFYRIVRTSKQIPPKIVKLTGLNQRKVNQEGISLEAALTDFKDFIGHATVVGYNVAFDWEFIERGYDKIGQDRLGNRIIDLLKVVRQKEVFLDNFRFETVLKYYQIENHDQHNSLADAEASIKLMTKLIEKGFLKI